MNHVGIRTAPAGALVFAASLLAALTVMAAESGDFRNIKNGARIYEHGYCDQPYVVVAPDCTWICVFTTSAGHEGTRSQYVVSTTSTDLGKSWSEPVPIEPPSEREASWAMPLMTDYGRIYAFYVFNGDNVRTLPNGKKMRADTHGWYCCKYSDDNGKTWSERRRLPMRVTACDRGNEFEGKVQYFWGIGKPITHEGTAWFAFTKLARYFLEGGEGWFYRSDNVLTEKDPAKVTWELLPEGDHGLRHPDFGSVQEEQNLVPLSNGDLYCMYRTTQGFPAEAYSRDGGRSWTLPEIARYANGRPFKHPRACPRIWRCSNGKFLFWHHNHGGTNFNDRNPAWISGGIERDGRILWSQPEILFYGDDLSYQTGRFSYPDLVEIDGRFWVTTTQKTQATIHEVDPALFNAVWSQGEIREVVQKGLVLNLPEASPGEVDMPTLPSLKDGGFTIDFWATFENLDPGQIILDSRSDVEGIAVSTAANGTIRIDFSDGAKSGGWDSDPGMVTCGKRHHIAIIVDGGPNIITFVVDGVVCDGGTQRQYGWGRFDPAIEDVNGGNKAKTASSLNGTIETLRIYDRYLLNSEAIANYHAGG